MASKLDAHSSFIRRQVRRNLSIRAIVDRLDKERGVKVGHNAVHHFVVTRFGDQPTRRLLTADLARFKKSARNATAASVALGRMSPKEADQRNSAWREHRVVSFEFAGRQVSIGRVMR